MGMSSSGYEKPQVVGMHDGPGHGNVDVAWVPFAVLPWVVAAYVLAVTAGVAFNAAYAVNLGAQYNVAYDWNYVYSTDQWWGPSPK